MLYLPLFGFISNGIWLEVIVPCKIIVFSMILPWNIIVSSIFSREALPCARFPS